MHDQEKKELQKLNEFNRWLVVKYWRWLLIKQRYQRQSLPMRLVPIHALCMLIITLSFPHKHIPIIAISSIIIAAYYITVITLFITIQPPRKRKTFHWVKHDR